MEDKNFTIIEDIFDDVNKDHSSFTRTTDLNLLNNKPYINNIPSLSYDEDMIKNKYNRQINPRIIASQYNSMSNSNRIIQQPQENKIIQKKIEELQPNIHQNMPLNNNTHLQLTCRNIYEHIENCPICNKYYKQSNRTYVLIIIFLILIILLLIRQNKN